MNRQTKKERDARTALLLRHFEILVMAGQLMTEIEKASLKKWERENQSCCKGLSTTDWPRWRGIINRLFSEGRITGVNTWAEGVMIHL